MKRWALIFLLFPSLLLADARKGEQPFTNVANEEDLRRGLARLSERLTLLHQGRMIEAWAKFDGSGTPALSGSYNIASITDNGTGWWTLNFSKAIKDINFATVCTAGPSYPRICSVVGVSASSVTVRVTDNSAVAQDETNINVMVVR